VQDATSIVTSDPAVEMEAFEFGGAAETQPLLTPVLTALSLGAGKPEKVAAFDPSGPGVEMAVFDKPA
jgi:hypothetical protein